LSEVSNTS